MPSELPFKVDINLDRNQILNPRFHLLASDPGNPIEGMYYWNTALRVLRYYDGTGWRNVTKTHSDLNGLDQDDHTIYMHVGIGRTVTAVHTFSPSAASPPFILGPNAINQKVVGFNADKLDGYDSSAFATAIHQHNVSEITDLAAFLADYKINQFGTATSHVNMGGNRIIQLGLPQQATDAASKEYVDASRRGLDYKDSVRVLYKAPSSATADSYITNATIPAIVDGISMNAVGTRVLILTDYEPQKSLQGIYQISSIVSGVVNVVRTNDAGYEGNLTSGLTVGVTEGAIYRGTTWALLTADPIVPDFTTLTFTQIGGPGETVGKSMVPLGHHIYGGRSGNNLLFRTLTGNDGIVLTYQTYFNPPSDIVTDGYIEISLDQTFINLPNLSGVLPVDKGGTNAVTPSQARINIGAVGRMTQLLGNNSSTTFNIAHQLGSRFVSVDVYENSAPYRKVMAAVNLTDNNNCSVMFNTPPTTNQFVALVHL